MKTIWLYFCLITGVALGLWAVQPPPPASNHAPADTFSAERALGDVRMISRHSHPTGSAEAAKVATYLTARLQQMGLSPSRFDDTGILQYGHDFARAARISDIVAVLPGTNPALPALAIVSHYDSVPHSPGAADDGAGVAASLEIARALAAAPHQRDVVLVFTDGEELGLLGAEAFFHRHAQVKHIGAVINFDARGASGRAAMFETGPQSGLLVGHLSGAVTANSATALIYDAMPNGTDFTLAKNLGLPGLNFAFIGDVAAYHTPLASAGRLDPGSLQHMGDQALSVARAVVASNGPLTGENLVYGDLYGRMLLQYPPVYGWVLLAGLALLLLLAFWRGRASEGGAVVRGLFCNLLIVALCALFLWPAGLILSQLSLYQRAPLLPLMSVGALCLTIGTLAFTSYAARSGRGRWLLVITIILATALSSLGSFDPVATGLGGASLILLLIGLSRPLVMADLWRGSLLLSFLLGLGLQIALPGAAPLVVWPLALSGLAAAWYFGTAGGRTHRPFALFLIGLVAITVLAQIATLGDFLFDALGLSLPAIMAVPMLLLLPAIMPLAGEAGGERSANELALLFAIAGIITLVITLVIPVSAERPMPSAVLYAQNTDKAQAFRIDPYKYLDPWARDALSAGGQSPVYAPVPGLYDTAVWSAPAPALRLNQPHFTITHAAGRLTIKAMPAPGDSTIEIAVNSSAPLSDSFLNGRSISGTVAVNDWRKIVFTAPPIDGVIWSFKAPAHGKMAVRVSALTRDWPKGAEALPPLPSDTILVGDAVTSRRSLTKSFKW